MGMQLCCTRQIPSESMGLPKIISPKSNFSARLQTKTTSLFFLAHFLVHSQRVRLCLRRLPVPSMHASQCLRPTAMNTHVHSHIHRQLKTPSADSARHEQEICLFDRQPIKQWQRVTCTNIPDSIAKCPAVYNAK